MVNVGKYTSPMDGMGIPGFSQRPDLCLDFGKGHQPPHRCIPEMPVAPAQQMWLPKKRLAQSGLLQERLPLGTAAFGFPSHFIHLFDRKNLQVLHLFRCGSCS